MRADQIVVGGTGGTLLRWEPHEDFLALKRGCITIAYLGVEAWSQRRERVAEG